MIEVVRSGQLRMVNVTRGVQFVEGELMLPQRLSFKYWDMWNEHRENYIRTGGDKHLRVMDYLKFMGDTRQN
jgi:hypothetical protein